MTRLFRLTGLSIVHFFTESDTLYSSI